MAGIVRLVGVLWLAMVCAAGTPGPRAYGQEHPRTGMTLYARHATEGDGPVKSPDGTKSVTIRRVDRDPRDPDGWHTAIVVRTADKKFVARLDGFRSEVLWSPDSRSFAVNEAVGGGGIGQLAYIFYVDADRLRRVDVSPAVDKAFGSPVKCEVPVPPNTAILRWLNPQRVLVAAEVVPVSICKCSGTFMSYEVSLPEPKILKTYTQEETKRLFADSLGGEFGDVDDACAKRGQKPRTLTGIKSF